MDKRKPPAWIYEYEKDYREGRIAREEIFRQENVKREAKQLPKLKFKSVSRAINALGFSSQGSLELEKPKPEQEQKQKLSEVPSSSSKPCYSCKYYITRYICEYPRSMFEVYSELSDFDRDFAEGRCKLKEK